MDAVAREKKRKRQREWVRAKRARLRKAPPEQIFEPKGQISFRHEKIFPLPPQGMVNRYILTSAQNDTYLHSAVWETLHQLRSFYQDDPRCHMAEILVSRFAYRNFQSADKAAWSAGRRRGNRLLWDPQLTPYLCDERVRLANHLVFCGEMNLSATARHPMATLESYNGTDSAVFPHPRVAMRSEPSVGFEGAKLLHTTGTVTQRNYIQRKAGLAAEFHHCYGAALAEVDHEGNFWVRQLNATEDGLIHDLDVVAYPGGVIANHRPAAIYLADLHPEELDEQQFATTLHMIRTLRPSQLFIGDIMSVMVSPHNRDDHLKRYALRTRGDNNLMGGARLTMSALCRILHAGGLHVKLSICRSNHDDHLLRWLTEEHGFKDPANARLWHHLNLAMMDEIEAMNGDADWATLTNPVRHILGCLGGIREPIRWLGLEEVAKVAEVNHGAHGHAGPNGQRATPEKLAKLGRKANYGHVHAPGIYDGAYFAGTHGRHRYYRGPSSSACANILTHATGKRQIIVNWRQRWRA